MGAISCTDYIRLLKEELDNRKEAARWQEEHLRKEVRSLNEMLLMKDAEIEALKKELEELRPYEIEEEPPQPPRAADPPRSIFRVVCDHVFRSAAPRSRHFEEDLG